MYASMTNVTRFVALGVYADTTNVTAFDTLGIYPGMTNVTRLGTRISTRALIRTPAPKKKRYEGCSWKYVAKTT